jgi:serine/threonine protein kinase
VKETLGSGTFGRVVKCVDHDVRSHDENTGQKRSVAIKIIKNKEEYRIQARTELAVLEAIESARIGLAEDEEEKEREEKRERARMKRNAECVVRAIEHFNFRTHACIVFELLHCNLYEWMVDQRFTGASERVCKTVAKQLARALSFLKSLGIIHCDVKPENILLERRSETVSANPLSKVSSYPSTARAGFPSSTQKYDAGNGNNIRVKLIDFGSSCFAHVPRIYPYVQSRFYRAPEVMLRDREYDQSIDMWSFACVLAELKRGSPIWPGTDEAEQLELAKETLGAPSSAFLNKLRREEESRKTSSDSDFDDELTKNSMKKHDSHARASLSRVVPTTPMKTKKGVKSRRLLADRANDPVETGVFDGEENENEHHHQHRDEDEDDFETTTSKTTAPAAPSSGSSSLFLPFETAREKASRRKLAAEGLKKALGRGCSIKFAQFLQKCFEWDPEERLTPDDALRHAWLKSFSVGSSSSSENDEIDLNRPTADDDGGFFAKYGNTKNGNGGFDRHPSASAR